MGNVINAGPSNMGSLVGGTVHVIIPEVGLNRLLVSYASDAVVARMKRSSPDFEGLAGLPLLRRMEYGGDADEFWILPAGGNP